MNKKNSKLQFLTEFLQFLYFDKNNPKMQGKDFKSISKNYKYLAQTCFSV